MEPIDKKVAELIVLSRKMNAKHIKDLFASKRARARGAAIPRKPKIPRLGCRTGLIHINRFYAILPSHIVEDGVCHTNGRDLLLLQKWQRKLFMHKLTYAWNFLGRILWL